VKTDLFNPLNKILRRGGNITQSVWNFNLNIFSTDPLLSNDRRLLLKNVPYMDTTQPFTEWKSICNKW
jgi:hypothetical protein